MHHRHPLRTICVISTWLLCSQCTTATAAESSATEETPRAVESRRFNIAVLVGDSTSSTELTAPLAVFAGVAAHTPDSDLNVFTVAENSGPTTTAEGLRLLPDHTFADHPSIDILVVPGLEDWQAGVETNTVIDWVRRVGGGADYVLSLDRGSLILADAGLLAGRACTTAPGDYERLATRYPDLDLRINASVVHDGPVITSQGGDKSYDAALYLVELLFGRQLAAEIGGDLLVPWPPSDRPRPTFVTVTAPALD